MISIAFTGGGTGGHIYPGLAVAAALKKRLDCRIFWIGSDKGMDKSIVEAAEIEFFGIPSGKLRRYFSVRNFLDIFKIAAGFFAARKILKSEKPSLLFSKGGFVSVPPVVAASSLKIPVFTHESDFSPGLATKINSRFSKRIFVAYQDTISQLPSAYKERITVTGNPVRPVFYAADPRLGHTFLDVKESDRILLVLGGSQGAQEINNLVWNNLAELTKTYTVVHQIGHGTPLEEINIPNPERYKPYPYIGEEMPHILVCSELVLGRSGAGTIWECAATGKPMVLIPLRGSGTRGDQVENARFFEKARAAVMLTNTDLLVKTILDLSNNRAKQEEMAKASCTVGSLDGASFIADIIQKTVKEGS